MSDLEIVSSSEVQFERNTRAAYDAVYENDITENETVNVAHGDIAAENENTIEEVYEEAYQENRPQYATNSNKSESIVQKFLKNKMVAISVLLVVCTVGIVVGIAVYFTQPPIIAVASNTTVSRTTTASPTDTTSARGTPFSIQLNKLNVHLSLLFISAYT